MSGTFEAKLRVFIDKHLSPEAQSHLLAETAKRERDRLIRAGRAPDSYVTFTDGARGVPEEQVKPNGRIFYQFNLLPAAVEFALHYLVRRSPRETGAYRRAWFVAVAGQRWTGPIDKIPAGREVIITNDRPYHRMLEVGRSRMRTPLFIVEDARGVLRRQFPTLRVLRRFVDLPNAYVTQDQERVTYPALVLQDR